MTLTSRPLRVCVTAFAVEQPSRIEFVAFGKLFFSGRDSSSGNYVLWSYNGETAERVPGIDIVNPQYLTLSLTGPEVY